MFGILSKKEKPRVFLGTLEIIPRKDFKRYFEEWSMERRNETTLKLYGYLDEFFELPLASEIIEPRRTDLGLDVTILKYQLGLLTDVQLGYIGFPLIWRPKIIIQSRLYNLETNRTNKIYKVTQKMLWSTFVNRFFSWRNLFSFRLSVVLAEEDLKYMLYQASIKLMNKTRESI